ncbi:MAG: ChbG/HpnK family deacetylase [Candidatus Binatia bacterium]
MRHLIINADGYGFTAGTTRAIEECIEFGTVRSLSANVNFKHADGLAALVRKYPELSVGCHINPLVGPPVLPADQIPTLLDENGEFLYKTFTRKFFDRRIHMSELRAEMTAQVEKTRDMAGKAFSHIDFHMGLHRLPGLYAAFLDVAEASGVGRIRTHRYRVGMESSFPRLRHFFYLFESITRMPKFLWNLYLRRKALNRRLVMPDYWVGITHNASRPEAISVKNYLMMLRNLPRGFCEFVAHPGYVDEELKRWATYLDQRILEREVLLSSEFRDALSATDVHLAGYRDIPLR